MLNGQHVRMCSNTFKYWLALLQCANEQFIVLRRNNFIAELSTLLIYRKYGLIKSYDRYLICIISYAISYMRSAVAIKLIDNAVFWILSKSECVIK